MKSMLVSDFLAIKDTERQRYVVTNYHIQIENKYKIINNDEKLGYYYITHDYKANNSGTFYSKTSICEWIVYNKVTKKVKQSKNCHGVFNLLLEEYTSFPDIIRMMTRNPSSTLSKRLIEGKIETVGDYIKYIKSYTLRGVKISDHMIIKYANHDNLYALPVIENPDDVDMEDIHRIPNTVIKNKLFKIKNVKNAREEYDNWLEESKRINRLKGSRDATPRDYNGQKFWTESEDLVTQVFTLS